MVELNQAPKRIELALAHIEDARMALGRLLPCLDADHAACMPHAMEALCGLDLALAALRDACS